MIKIFKNLLYMFISNVAVRGLTAVATIMLARYLGARGYGILSVALAYYSIAGFFADLGLTHTFIREAAKPEANTSLLLGTAIKLRLSFALLTGVLVFSSVYFVYPDAYVRRIVLLVTIPTILGASIQGVGMAFFQGLQEMKFTALISIASGLVTAVTILLGIKLQWGLNSLALVYGLSSAGGALASMLLLKSYSIQLKGWHKGLLSGLGAFTFSGIFGLALPQLGPLILEKVTNLSQVGFFSAAYRIPALLYQLPGTVAVAFYPALFSIAAVNLAEHKGLCVNELKIMSCLGFALAFPFALYPSELMEVLFGREWAQEAATILRVLAWLVALQSVNYSLGDALTTRNLQSRRTYGYGIALLLGMSCYWILGANYGALGAAYAALLVETLLMILFTTFNPVGPALLVKGILKNLIALSIVLAIGTLIQIGNPLLGSILLEGLFLIIVLGLDREIRLTIKSLITNRLKMGFESGAK
ncbi:Membrane protein involved in the export of O-antigen and teichoic acid [Desulfosporosinus hippei DSM 8344]|uniref:Membrane protein involved in the export of O-antigen and teichoic acid n=2 Tax=Desulfosporosinus TaxID=79206 RepID=A0A1G8H188_9FIRM|nr:Membrane protein involved in the export of O-antigen and teichoic acid [Desulfosporosinus hippei DSM 8344]